MVFGRKEKCKFCEKLVLTKKLICWEKNIVYFVVADDFRKWESLSKINKRKKLKIKNQYNEEFLHDYK